MYTNLNAGSVKGNPGKFELTFCDPDPNEGKRSGTKGLKGRGYNVHVHTKRCFSFWTNIYYIIL